MAQASTSRSRPMLALGMTRSLTQQGSTRLPMRPSGDKFAERMKRQREQEEEQRLQDLADVAMTAEQFASLQRSFADVKVEFADLDGLSWGTPEAQCLLARWYKSQVMALRRAGPPDVGRDCTPRSPSRHAALAQPSAAGLGSAHATIRAGRTARFPPCLPLAPPPLTLPAGLREYIDAVAAGLITNNPPATSKLTQRRLQLPPHRVFSLPPRVPPSMPAMARETTVRPAVLTSPELGAEGGGKYAGLGGVRRMPGVARPVLDRSATIRPATKIGQDVASPRGAKAFRSLRVVSLPVIKLGSGPPMSRTQSCLGVQMSPPGGCRASEQPFSLAAPSSPVLACA
ncbi:hypothetical protein WOLCODRAFT_141049 [Wolfiporia cocos MD-104 SS10]|uniref:Uncharacterized protein n=1 Tax=Wolfiporia cocos (strain MD-104) TaxID=742152 RepID=A0A2H3JMQ8_WOLCO|nr:hypothetical protein WOLCODRAFT_141049 [Wolfiporia cocos MD-104 SS10]